MEFMGFFYGDQSPMFLLGSIFAVLAVGFYGAPLIVWTITLGVLLVGWAAPIWLLAIFGAWAVIYNIPPLRRIVVSSGVMQIMTALKIVPVISETERTALEAGVVWVEADLFSGKPNFASMLKEPYPYLTPEEKAFLDGPVEKLCSMIDDWAVWENRDLDPAVWEYIKKEKFLGMIIPKEYGGLQFSALAHSEVIMKIASRSIATCISVMVPNSLGPAELLIHYGTDEQKKNLLPKLARGEEIPCFALTEPNAGSDAGAIQSYGVLFKGTDGKKYIRLNWNKRWITLASIATLLGVAFRLRDPDNILGKGEDVGITCALIPSKTPGVSIGRRHDPMGVPFYNCPTQGKDVVIPLDYVVGAEDGVGKGWGMLMDCLAAGRGISLPAQSVGGAKLATKVVTAHASIRKQFGIPIGKFEGVEEPIARIAGYCYLLEAFRRFTLGALDKGIKPPVITAIAKYHSTEIGRKVINDAMDVLGGAAISRGPRNLLASVYTATPIGITVEGANILTRTLIIFGQGALRAHPYAYKEVTALANKDLKGFDEAFWGHIGHVIRNGFRAILLSMTRGWLVWPTRMGSVAKYYRRMSWVSATFAIMADIAMGSLGGNLKFREKITGRFADILSWMYIGTSILRRFEAEGSRREDLPFVHFTMTMALYEIQKAFDGIFANLTVPGLGWLFKGPIRWWSNLNALAGECSDQHTHKIASMMMADTEQRVRFTEGIYMPSKDTEQLARLEKTFHLVKQAEGIDHKIRQSVKSGSIPKAKGAALLQSALQKGIITQQEFDTLALAEKMRFEAIQVDDFSQDEFLNHASAGKVASPSCLANNPLAV